MIHLILDNFRIHHSRITQAALHTFGDRIRLHLPPPYCPHANRIKRLCLDLHAEVTRNHQQRTTDDLMKQVWRFVRRSRRQNQNPNPTPRRATQQHVARSCAKSPGRRLSHMEKAAVGGRRQVG